MQFFSLFIDDDVIQMLVNRTNEHANKIITTKEAAGNLTLGLRWRNWRPVNPQEMRAVLAIMLNMGIIHCPDIESYWKKSSFSCRDRFETIFWTLHIKTILTRRRLDKIRPLLDRVLATSQGVFSPGREVSVDETMVGFKGVVGFQQYCPPKLTKWGLKSFVLADSATGCSKHHSVHWR